MREKHLRIQGRVLYLTEDRTLLQRQLAGEDLPEARHEPLINNISTDELTPGWSCFYFDETLARYCLVGLRGGLVATDAIKNGGFGVIVSGRSKGCGSSRETAPFAELAAGVQLVIAQSIEKIYGQNAHNIGLLTSTDFSLLDRIERGEELSIDEFTQGLDPISRDIVEQGGLFEYNRARFAGELVPPQPPQEAHPMTLCEKLIAENVVVNTRKGWLGVRVVSPGDSVFVRTDLRFSHEYVTAMADALFRRGFGEDARVEEPGSVFAFRDHLTFLDQVMPTKHRQLGLAEQATLMARVQDDFCKRNGVRLFGEVERDGKPAGSEAICHNKVIEELALPGQIVLGTDSHTCMAGCLGCFAFGVGATDMANAWFTRDVRLRVPESIRIELRGQLRRGVAAKDLILYLLSLDYFREGKGIGQVLEFGGSGLAGLSIDERATLTNMAVEAGGFTGIVEADEVVVEYLAELRGLDRQKLRARCVTADPGARYAARFEVDLASISPMVATPGDPRNGVTLGELTARDGKIAIHLAYGGSCTGGKKADMDMYAAVLAAGLARGERVASGVEFFIQFGSQEIRRYAAERGYLDVFERAGAKLIEPSCGACIGAGPGVSTSADQVTVSAINRNFPGRSGPGKVYLASPLVVAASALAGHLAFPEQV